jgi:HSP20 family protein
MRNALDLWRGNFTPSRDLGSLHRGIDRWFEDFFEPLAQTAGTTAFNPPVDIDETDSHYLLSFDLPGVTENDVKVEWNDGQLMISGERRTEKKDEKSRRVVERSYGRFMRSFSLPSGIDANRIEADFRDGVLKVSVPKAEAARPKTIQIGRSSKTAA